MLTVVGIPRVTTSLGIGVCVILRYCFEASLSNSIRLLKSDILFLDLPVQLFHLRNNKESDDQRGSGIRNRSGKQNSV